jgi:hypothetical protein
MIAKELRDAFRCALRIVMTAGMDPGHHRSRTRRVQRAAVPAGCAATHDTIRTFGRFDGNLLIAEQDLRILGAGNVEERFGLLPRLRGFVTSVRAAAEGKVDEVLATLQKIDASTFPDGEGLFYLAETYACIDREAEALHLLEQAIRGGFVCLPAFERNPFLSSLRTSRAWQPLIDEVRRRQHVTLDAYEVAGGQALLGHV